MKHQAKAPDRLRWFKYVKPYLPWFIIGPLCMIVEVIGEVVMPKLLAYIIDFSVTHEMTDPPAWLSWLYGVLGQSFDDPDAPLVVALAVVLYMLISQLVDFVTSIYGEVVYRFVKKV